MYVVLVESRIVPDTEAPSVPTGLSGTALDSSRIDLSWSASTDTGGSGLAGYRVYRDGVELTTTTAPSYSDTGLAAVALYTYTVEAYDNAGNSSVPSAPVSVTTGGSGSGGGTALSITGTTPSSYVWGALDVGGKVYIDRSYTYTDVSAAYLGLKALQTANDDKVSTGSAFLSFTVDQPVTVYVAYDRRPSSLPAWLQGWQATGDGLLTTDVPHDLYMKDFAAGVVTLGGNGGAGSMYTVLVASGAAGGSDPKPTVSLSASPSSIDYNATTTLTWSSTDATSCDASGAWSGPKASSGIESVGPLTSDSTFMLICSGAGGQATASASVTVAGAPDTSPPSVPAGLSGTAFDSSRIDLSWSASTDTGGSGLAGYRVYREGVEIGTTTVPSYSDTGLAAVTSYTYTVEAYDNAGNSSVPSAPVSVTTGGSSTGGGTAVSITGTTPSSYVWGALDVGGKVYIDRSYTYTDVPAAYQGLKVLQTANDDKGSTGSAFLSFTVDQPVTVYVAYGSRASSLPAWLQGWQATGDRLLTTDVPHDLYKKEFAAGVVTLGGNGGAGSMYTVLIATGQSGGGTVELGAATLSWTPPTTNADGTALTDLSGHKIYYGNSSGNYTTTIDVNSAGISSYVVENLAPGTYHFAVTAYDSAGNESAFSNEASKVIN
jgi:chitodextrinase